MPDWRDAYQDWNPEPGVDSAIQRVKAEARGQPPLPLPPGFENMMPPGMVQWPQHLSPGQVLGRTALEEVPAMAGSMTGAAVGAMTGPFAPVAVPAFSGIGGALGRAASIKADERTFPDESRPDFGNAVRDEFLWDAGLAGAGKMVGGGVKMLGRRVYGAGLRGAGSLHEKFPGMERYGAERGILRLPDQAKAMKSNVAGVEGAMARASAGGKSFRMSDYIDGILDQTNELYAAHGKSLSKKDIDAITKSAYEEVYTQMQNMGFGRTGLPAPETMNAQAIRALKFPIKYTHLMKRGLQAAPPAQASFTRERTAGIPAEMRPNYTRSLASGTRSALSDVPEYDRLMAEQRNLKGLGLVMKRQAAMKSPTFGQLTAMGVSGAHAGIPAAILAGGATDPTALRAYGILMNSAIPQAGLRYGPLAARHLAAMFTPRMTNTGFEERPADLTGRDQFQSW